MLILGAHLSKNKYGYLATIAEIIPLGGMAVSIFTGSPRELKLINIPEAELDEISKFVENRKILLFSHGKYLYNLARPYEGKYKFAIKSMAHELDLIGKMGGIGTVIHFGKSQGIPEDTTFANTVENIQICLKKYKGPAYLILETSSGQGSEMFTKIPEIETLWNVLPKSDRKRIKFCIDTCHTFASGYDIRSKAGMKAYLKLWIKIGLSKIALIHFNDSLTPLGSNVDRHAPFGVGYITNTQLGGEWSGIKYLLNFCIKRSIPLILERGSGDREKLVAEIQMIKDHR